METSNKNLEDNKKLKEDSNNKSDEKASDHHVAKKQKIEKNDVVNEKSSSKDDENNDHVVAAKKQKLENDINESNNSAGNGTTATDLRKRNSSESELISDVVSEEPAYNSDVDDSDHENGNDKDDDDDSDAAAKKAKVENKTIIHNDISPTTIPKKRKNDSEGEDDEKPKSNGEVAKKPKLDVVKDKEDEVSDKKDEVKDKKDEMKDKKDEVKDKKDEVKDKKHEFRRVKIRLKSEDEIWNDDSDPDFDPEGTTEKNDDDDEKESEKTAPTLPISMVTHVVGNLTIEDSETSKGDQPKKVEENPKIEKKVEAPPKPVDNRCKKCQYLNMLCIHNYYAASASEVFIYFWIRLTKKLKIMA